MLCRECDNCPMCTILCRDAAKYVNQDYIAQRYSLLGEDVNLLITKKWPQTLAIPYIVISLFFKNNLKQAKIAKRLKISHQYVTSIIRQYQPIYDKFIQKTAF